jgi:hypothetical protein
MLPNQHSNGILEFESISESDIGEYICHGENRVSFSEEIVIIEVTGIHKNITQRNKTKHLISFFLKNQ